MNVFILEAGNGIPLLLAPLSLMIDIFTYGREGIGEGEEEGEGESTNSETQRCTSIWSKGKAV